MTKKEKEEFLDSFIRFMKTQDYEPVTKEKRETLINDFLEKVNTRDENE